MLYNWGRGEFGVLGNGCNSSSLVPKLNDSVEAMKQENQENDENAEENNIE